MTNHFLQFLALDRADPKKFQVLQLIAALLQWTDGKRTPFSLLHLSPLSPCYRLPFNPPIPPLPPFGPSVPLVPSPLPSYPLLFHHPTLIKRPQPQNSVSKRASRDQARRAATAASARRSRLSTARPARRASTAITTRIEAATRARNPLPSCGRTSWSRRRRSTPRPLSQPTLLRRRTVDPAGLEVLLRYRSGAGRFGKEVGRSIYLRCASATYSIFYEHRYLLGMVWLPPMLLVRYIFDEELCSFQ